MTNSVDNSGLTPLRPRFLKVLCYLTIFGSSYMIVSALTALTELEQLKISLENSIASSQELFEQVFKNGRAEQDQLEQMLSDVSVANTTSNLRDYNIFSAVSNLLTLLGAGLMLRLRKNGFRLYVLGTLIGVVAPVLVFGYGNFLGFAFAFSSAFFGGLFTLLYALKMKYMY